MRIAICLFMLLSLVAAAFGAEEVVGKRPYEMDWANRFQDDHPPLVDFENLDGWTVTTGNSAASIVRTRSSSCGTSTSPSSPTARPALDRPI